MGCQAEDCFWEIYYKDKSQDIETVNTLVNLLNQLSQEYFWAIQSSITYHGYSITTEDVISQVKLYSVTDNILNSFAKTTTISEIKNKDFALRFDVIRYMLTVDSHSLLLRSKNTQNLWQEQYDYWSKKERTNHPFFPSQKYGMLWDYGMEELEYYPTNTDRENANDNGNEESRPDNNNRWWPDEINFLLQYRNSVRNENSYLGYLEEVNDIDIALMTRIHLY